LPGKWVVDCKRVGNGEKALVYLGRYLYRGVIREADLLLSRARRLEGAEDLAPEFPAASAHARLVLAEAALLRGAPAEDQLQAARQDAGDNEG